MSSDGSPVRHRGGALDATGLRVAIVVASFHADITDRLLEGALAALSEHGVSEDDISVILMADHGVDLYGNAIIVNTDWAAENEDTLPIGIHHGSLSTAWSESESWCFFRPHWDLKNQIFRLQRSLNLIGVRP